MSFQTNKEISTFFNIQSEIDRILSRLLGGKFGSKFISAEVDRAGAIDSLQGFKELKNDIDFSIEDLENDINILGGLFQQEPEIVTRLEPFSQQIIETNISQRDRQRVKTSNNEIQSEIDQRNNLLNALNLKTTEKQNVDIIPTPGEKNNLLIPAVIVAGILLL